MDTFPWSSQDRKVSIFGNLLWKSFFWQISRINLLLCGSFHCCYSEENKKIEKNYKNQQQKLDLVKHDFNNQTSTLPWLDKWVLNVSMTYCHGKSFLNFKLHKILFFWWNTQFIVSNYPSDAQSLNDAKFSVASIWYEWILHAISKISWNCSVESLTWNLFTNTLALPP